ncbi:Histidine kinase group protein [Teratosphaeria destructans]|uniref:Histidine kinase group protein n=1 Tax=Teratosphaeria destructans TaxID=418781 RepID=A0A9W7T074_9PEZI|nr:Histidine kinase group protein [Teratosphaeria destructans]
MAKKKGAQAQGDTLPMPGSSLIICRNKHWRYISSFHGPWLQLPPEILDSLAHQNYTMPAPRLVDPAVFYDVVKIRKAVDEAAQDSVRASTGISNTAMNGRMDYFGAGGGPGSQLSKERIFKIRQKAVKLLSKAFTLDEVAASVATMQATSTVEDVGQHVLKREPHSTDAKYVHFFHEKIPSRAMEHYTPLDPLNEIILSLPMEHQAPPLRTRALVQIFKQQWEGAAQDLTYALRIVEELESSHKPNKQELELASKMREEQDAWNKGHRDWRSVPHLKEEEQPKSLKQQLLFNRAGVYLTIACQSVHPALDGLKEYQAAQERGETTVADAKAQAARLEARKRVKVNAKKAMKDYLSFLSHFDYTPGLPFEITNEIMRRVYDLANGNKTQTPLPKNRLVELDHEGKEVGWDGEEANGNGQLIKHQKPKPEPFERGEDGWPRFPSPRIHPASALFAEKPPADVPPFPNEKTTNAMLNNETINEAFGSREAVTYHPLLTDALHSLLLSHALVQTSPTELLRHAHNAARLARIADGYPIFQAARSPARADWIEVLRRANNWLGLVVPWQKLCAPAPLPEAAGGWAKDSGSGIISKRRERKEETAEQKRERIKQESIIDALSDDRVVDEESFQKAVRARERRAMEDEQGISGPLKDKDTPALPDTSSASSSSPATPKVSANGSGHSTDVEQPLPQPKRWAQDENGKEYPISTDRAEAIARWIKEAPLSMGGKKKKRRPAAKKPASAAANGVGTAAHGVGNLAVGGDEDEEGPD